MQSVLAHHPARQRSLRAARSADLAALTALEQKVFRGDRISRRAFRRFIHSPRAAVIVAEEDGVLAGYVLVLFRSGSGIARLYSIAVAPEFARRGLGKALLTAAEGAAIERARLTMRLEVHESNARAIARYRKAGYELFGRHAHYYADRGHALRFEKRLRPQVRFWRKVPQFFHQTTEFTCGPACVMMALVWADPGLKLSPGLEFKLWRESTTIFMSAGPGGCEPYGLAVSLRRHGLYPEIHVNDRGPYFLDTVRSEDKRQVMRITQQQFQRDAAELGIPTRLTAVNESALIAAFDSGAAAIVLFAGYHMIRKAVPHWVFAFGHEGRYILIHDPARDERRNPVAEPYAVPWPVFARMTRFGRDHLSATILVRKGNSP